MNLQVNQLQRAADWQQKLICTTCGQRLFCENAPLRASAEEWLRCRHCGTDYSSRNGVLEFSEDNSFYEEEGFVRTGRDFGSRPIQRLQLWLARHHYFWDVANSIPAGSSIVELGCGGGSQFLGRRYSMLGVDLSSSSVLRASQVYSMVIKANCVRLPLMDQSVDAVISSFLLEHLECAEFEQFFREMARILRPDGCMVHYLDLEDNSRFTQWAKQQAWYHRLFVVERGHYSLRPIEEWRTCFQKAGFQAEKERYSCKTWIQDPSIWSRLADPAVAQPYRSIGRVSRGLSRVLGPALNVAVDLYQDTVERFYPHSWASKAIWVLKPTLSSLSK